MPCDRVDNLLPSDDELVRRDNTLLALFNKYSIDEGEDAELVDFDFSHIMVEDDDNAAGSSFSESSSIEGDDANDGDTVMDDIAEKLEPVIQERVNAWPEKGINLQLKRVDPSVSVEEWLKNQESTTTTEKYKKVVVNEENKTTTTTMKQTKTTTQRATFRAIQFPRPMALNNVYHQQILPDIDKCPDDITATHEKAKYEHISKPNHQQPTSKGKVNKMPVTIELSKLPNVNVSKLTKPKQPYSEQTVDHPADSLVIKKTKQPTKRPDPHLDSNKEPKTTQNSSKSKKKILQPVELPPVVMQPVDENKRVLRSTLKKNAVLPVRDERSVDKPTKTLRTSAIRDDKASRTVMTTAKKSGSQSKVKSKKQDDLMDSEPLAIVSPEKTNDSAHRSRLPLKDKQTNRRETHLSNVRVNLTRLPCPKVTTTANRSLSSIDDQAIEIPDIPTVGIRGRGRPRKALKGSERQLSSYHHVTTIENTTAEASSVQRRPLLPRKTLMKNPSQPTIVIHSPNSDTILGTKIDDTMMLVTQSDYRNSIHVKYARNTSVFKRNIIPINRRILYQPPIHDATADTDNDSECEDVLLSSYVNTGRFVQVKI
ncbi:uncharacterized protein LOC119084317 [Bradysia coprophila]|uniref:uncharacterized protein LOC119084317 n=1 Tax=Bradysia coprophila TaxID=38358 RepID=UPI00187D880F|nr:uncharacterized protein LOC119084317 [Bradysia coprophila]